VQYLCFPKSLTVQSKYQQQRNDADLKIWIKSLRIPNQPSLGYDTVEVTNNDFITPTGLDKLGINEQVTVNGNTYNLAHGLNKLNPLLENEVLDFKEAQNVESYISIGQSLSNPSYNSIITTMVTAKNSKFLNKVAGQYAGIIRNPV